MFGRTMIYFSQEKFYEKNLIIYSSKRDTHKVKN